MKLGLIGFGEAGSAFARTLRDIKAVQVTAFDVAADTDRVKAKAAEAGVTPTGDLAELVAGADIVFSLVTSATAESAARSASPLLAKGQLFADLNSTSPGAKRRIGGIIAEGKGAYVEAAVMAAVPPSGHRVPLLLAGPNAAALAAKLRPHEFSVEVAGDELGAASAVKMLRSVLMKGISSLIIESASGAAAYGATERVLRSAGASIGLDLVAFADRMGPRQLAHAERRVHEMEDVAETLREVGVDPVMSVACARHLRAMVDSGAPASLAGSLPADLAETVRLLNKRD